MLLGFTVKNYKNFKNAVTIDFSKCGGYQFNSECITDGVISKMLVYGRNATGKTNLGRALLDIKNIISGYAFSQDVFSINADSDDRYATYKYEFLFGGERLEYEYDRGEDGSLLREKLMIQGDGIFEIDFAASRYHFDLEKVGAETVVTDVYVHSNIDDFDEDNGRLPFLRWLLTNAAMDSASPLVLLSQYVRNMKMQSLRASMGRMPELFYRKFYDKLSAENNLKEFETFLNEMGVGCELDLKQLPDGDKELYFKHERPIPFIMNASSGTIMLMNLYQNFILPMNTASMIFMDEFDAFYHYEMSDSVVQYLKRHFPKCQIIMTTHNTNLMSNRLMRPDCLMILSQEGHLTPLCDATERELREGHNLEKMYISGEFIKYE